MATQDDNNSWEHIGQPICKVLQKLEKQIQGKRSTKTQTVEILQSEPQKEITDDLP